MHEQPTPRAYLHCVSFGWSQMMGFSMFSASASPIAIDFGSSSLKILQVSGEDHPVITAAGAVEVPYEVRSDPALLLDFHRRALPGLLKSANVKGKRAVCAVPSLQTHIQHMQLNGYEKDDVAESVKLQLQAQTGCSPRGVVVRPVPVTEITRSGQNMLEVICFAVTREKVMRYVQVLKACKLVPVGVHTETLAMVRSFEHLNRRADDDEISTLYADFGWSGTRVAIAHGKDIKFARYVPFGGRQFDESIGANLNCDLATAREHRLAVDSLPPKADNVADSSRAVPNDAAVLESAMIAADSKQQTPSPATTTERRSGQLPGELARQITPYDTPAKMVDVDLSQTLDTYADELSMGLRYHQALFPERQINRVVFLGGEARQSWLCQRVTQTMGLTAQMGDPLARMKRSSGLQTPGLDLDAPQPGWAVPCGLCTAPTDL
ncbi:MAG: pilus assembly protein PilM [Planctomycetota bacterium]